MQVLPLSTLSAHPRPTRPTATLRRQLPTLRCRICRASQALPHLPVSFPPAACLMGQTPSVQDGTGSHPGTPLCPEVAPRLTMPGTRRHVGPHLAPPLPGSCPLLCLTHSRTDTAHQRRVLHPPHLLQDSPRMLPASARARSLQTAAASASLLGSRTSAQTPPHLPLPVPLRPPPRPMSTCHLHQISAGTCLALAPPTLGSPSCSPGRH